ncbi:MAG TPA: hypothetical protein VGZ29_05575 [Terriglobia bacterium]|nr:hypothetical protein [Terriglobia bacterium]
MDSAGGLFAGLGLVGFVVVAVLLVIYILLPLKLWRMADRIKKVLAEAESQTATLRRIASAIEALASRPEVSVPDSQPKVG